MILVGQGALARPDGAAVASLAARAAVELGALKDGWNGFAMLHTAASRVGGLDIGFVPGDGRLARDRDGGVRHARRGVPARRRRNRRRARRVSSSISGPTAIAARIAPTSSCRAPPIPKNPASTSTPKAACRWPTAPCSRRATRAKTGRSCAHCRSTWPQACPTTRSAQLRAALFKAHPHLQQIDEIAPGDRGDVRKLAGLGGTTEKAAFALADRGFLPDQPDRARLRGDGGMFGARRRRRQP